MLLQLEVPSSFPVRRFTTSVCCLLRCNHLRADAFQMRVDKSILLLKVFAAGSQLDNVLLKDALLLGPAQLRLNKRVFSGSFSLLRGMELGQCMSLT